MISQITDVITGIVGAFWDVIVNGMSSLTDVFYLEGELTFWGVLAFIGLGLSLVFFIIRWVRSLIKQ